MFRIIVNVLSDNHKQVSRFSTGKLGSWEVEKHRTFVCGLKQFSTREWDWGWEGRKDRSLKNTSDRTGFCLSRKVD